MLAAPFGGANQNSLTFSFWHSNNYSRLRSLMDRTQDSGSCSPGSIPGRGAKQMEFFLLVLILLILFTFAYGGWRGAPWVPAKKADIERILQLVELKEGVKFYDLGAGDGRLIAEAAKKGAEAVGYEIAIVPYFIAKLRILFLNKKTRCKIIYKDFWFVDLKDADVIYFFLMPKTIEKLKPKLEKELKRGAMVISYIFPINGWEALKTDKNKGRSSIYLYEI